MDLSDRIRNICFIQGPISDRIQTIVRSRNYQNFGEIAETALVEENAIASKHERHGVEGVSGYRYSNCGKPGHSSNKCYSRNKEKARIKPIVAIGSGAVSQVTCLRFREKGYIARNCQKPPRPKESDDNRRLLGKRSKTAGEHPLECRL